MQNTKDLHQQAEWEREKENFVHALQLYEEVIVRYQKEKNYQGIAETLQGKVLTYKHLYLTTQDSVYVHLARSAGQTSLNIVEEYGYTEMRAPSFFRLGEVEDMTHNYQEAAQHYQKALETHIQNTSLDQPDAITGYYRYHLGKVLYPGGKKKEGEEAMKKGLEEIHAAKNSIESDYVAHVWESGALISLAEALMTDKPDEARAYLDQAQTIIHADNRLVIRARQLTQLKGKMV